MFDVQRAVAYYKVCRGSFSGTTSSFGVRPNNLTNFLYLFDDASKRLQDVIIENKDCLDIIRERDGPDSLIYFIIVPTAGEDNVPVIEYMLLMLLLVLNVSVFVILIISKSPMSPS